MFTIVANPNAKHQRDHQTALAAGLARHGIKSVLSGIETHIGTDLVACWGWRIGKRLKDAGKRVLVMERGYIGDRFSYTSLAFNGLNGHAEFPDYSDTGERLAALGVELKPWKQDGRYALILGQVPNDASLKGQNLVPWYTQIADEIKQKHGLPVYFRKHPDLDKKGIRQRVAGTIESRGTLQEALANAAFTVCYNSNSSVDSVLAGIPCVVGDKGSMAWDMCSHSIDEIVRPDRQRWAELLACKQWTMEEIASGAAVQHILKML